MQIEESERHCGRVPEEEVGNKTGFAGNLNNTGEIPGIKTCTSHIN
jgi:hypothetical protein